VNRDEDVFQNPDVFDMKRVRGKEVSLGHSWESIDASRSGLQERNWRLYLVGLRVSSGIAERLLTSLVATLWQRVPPSVRLAIPFDQVKYSPSEKVAGVIELPILF
jgi:nitric oxide reductase